MEVLIISVNSITRGPVLTDKKINYNNLLL